MENISKQKLYASLVLFLLTVNRVNSRFFGSASKSDFPYVTKYPEPENQVKLYNNRVNNSSVSQN